RMISWLGSAIAMLLAFRTNRSFERYNQGSQLWTNLATQIRNCSRLIWNSVTLRSEEGLVEKNSIMKLLLATAVATKHALRGADPYKFQDLRRLLPDDFITGGAYVQNDECPLLTPVPLDILHQINHYVRRQRHSGDVVQEDSSAVMNAISTAIDSVTKFEQILYFPVPTTYDVHIKHVMLLYFAFLPFQLVKSMGWAMILATFVMAITFFGIDAIAGEIAEPFGTDENDLPLDYFCHKLQ
ncbi:Bestrophin/UPF0187, partial [Chytriomyces sp. MP71]